MNCGTKTYSRFVFLITESETQTGRQAVFSQYVDKELKIDKHPVLRYQHCSSFAWDDLSLLFYIPFINYVCILVPINFVKYREDNKTLLKERGKKIL
jgi:hypothetical protein